MFWRFSFLTFGRVAEVPPWHHSVFSEGVCIYVSGGVPLLGMITTQGKNTPGRRKAHMRRSIVRRRDSSKCGHFQGTLKKGSFGTCSPSSLVSSRRCAGAVYGTVRRLQHITLRRNNTQACMSSMHMGHAHDLSVILRSCFHLHALPLSTRLIVLAP